MEQQRDNGTHDYNEEDDEYGEKDRTINGLEDLQSGQAKADRATPGGKEEDVFLKLARSETVTKDKLKRRKVYSPLVNWVGLEKLFARLTIQRAFLIYRLAFRSTVNLCLQTLPRRLCPCTLPRSTLLRHNRTGRFGDGLTT
jgi:hypothetical protein